MRLNRTLALGASALVLLSACATGGGGTPTGGPAGTATAAAKPAVRIGSAGFTESKLLGELYGQALEAKGYTIERKLGLGPRTNTQPAIESGQIDLMPEYLGSLLGFLDKTKPSGDPNAELAALQPLLAAKNITVLTPAPAQDQNGFVVRKDTADQYNLTKISDLAPIQNQLKWGLPPECKTNPLCAGALKEKYGIEPRNIVPLAACDAPIAQALQNRGVDVAELCTTQAAIVQFGFVLLEDDKQSQPAENIIPIVRNDYLAKVNKDEFSKILNDVSAKLTTEELTKLNVKTDVDKQDPKDVAAQWLKDNGFAS
jgi:osmoprotectant transport system substrate-binding protein